MIEYPSSTETSSFYNTDIDNDQNTNNTTIDNNNNNNNNNNNDLNKYNGYNNINNSNNNDNIINPNHDSIDNNNESKKLNHLWSSIPNGEKYQNECATTLDEAIYCLLLAEPDFRGSIVIVNNTVELINLSRVSAGLNAIELNKHDINKLKLLHTNKFSQENENKQDIDIDNENDEQDSMTLDWFGNEMDSKEFSVLQELAFVAENCLKKARLNLVKGELPDRRVMHQISKAISILKFISQNQPNWE